VRRIGLVLLVLLAIAATAAAQEYISVSSVTADLDFSQDYDAITEGNSTTIQLDLPFTLESLNNTNSNITIVADSGTASTTINLTVNGVAVATNYEISGGSSATWTFPDFAAAGVDMNATSLTIVIEAVANNTASETLNLTCDDKSVVANFSYTVTEAKLSKPQVKFYDVDSFYSVKQMISVTQDSDVNISDVKVTFTYPDNALNQPVTSYNFGTLNTSETKSTSISFQKRGPYVEMVKSVEGADKYTTSIYIRALENLTASITIVPNKAPWSKYFPEFSEDRIIKIELNGKEVSWERGSIVIKELKLDKGVNVLNVTYSKPPIYVPIAAVTPWYEQPYLGVPAWIWIVAIAVLLIAIIAYGRR